MAERTRSLPVIVGRQWPRIQSFFTSTPNIDVEAQVSVLSLMVPGTSPLPLICTWLFIDLSCGSFGTVELLRRALLPGVLSAPVLVFELYLFTAPMHVWQVRRPLGGRGHRCGEFP